MVISNVLLGLGFLLIFFFLSSGIGTITVKNNSHFSENSYLIMPIGFIVFFSITFIVYIPFILLNINLFGLAIVELIKDVGILYYIFYKIKPVAHVWLKKLKLIFLLIVLAALFLVIQWLTINPTQSSDQIAYNGWLVFNKGAFTLQSHSWYNGTAVDNYGGVYFSQTWYYFNIIVALAFNLNINLLMFWIDGMIIYVFAISIIIALLSIFIKKRFVLKYIVIFIYLSMLTFIAHYDQPAIVGLEARTYLFIAVLIFFIYFTRNNDKSLIVWCNITFITAWSFSSSSIFIFGIFYYGVFIYMLFMKKQDIFSVILLMLVPLSVTLGLYIYYDSTVFFITVFVGVTSTLLLIILWIKYWTNEQFLKLDNFLYRTKWLALFGPVILMFSISMIYLLEGKIDIWLKFNPRGDGLHVGMNSNAWNVWITYALYWISSIAIVFFVVKRVRKIEYLYPLIFVTFACWMVFFNPLVSGFMDGKVIPNAVYHRVRTDFFVPIMLMIGIFLVRSFKVNYLYVALNITLATAVGTPIMLNVSQIPRNSFFNATASKGVEEVANFLNTLKQRNKSTKFQMDGDIMGMRALTNIPMGPFLRGETNYGDISGTNVSNQTFEKNKELWSNQKNEWIFIKVKSLIKDDFNYKKYGWKLKFDFDNYVVYIPFYPA